MVDEFFPVSDPRIVVPALKEDGTWPHVEGEGRLCLAPSEFGADAGARILFHIECAVDLLNFDRPTRSSEFQREFATYWQRTGRGAEVPKHLSLLEPSGPSREVWYAKRTDGEALVWADSKEEIKAWFEHAGDSLNLSSIRSGWMAWLRAPLIPEDFPRKGRDVFALASIPDDVLDRVARLGSRFPHFVGRADRHWPDIRSGRNHAFIV